MRMKPKNKPVPLPVNCSVCGKTLVFSEGHDVSDCRHTIRFDLNGNATLPPNIVAPAHKEPTLEVSMTEDERIVREAWDEDFISISLDGAVFLCVGECGVNLPSMHAAAEFTTARREEIRQVEKEITTIADDLCDIANWRIFLEENTDLKGIVRYVRYQCRCCRILAREQAALADLQRGMKEEPHGKTE
jgi:hypothetical protein